MDRTNTIHKASKLPEYKKKAVEDLSKLFKKYPIVGVMNMENLASAQLGKMRKQLRGSVELFMTKRRVMHFAIDKAKKDVKGLDELEKKLVGMPALLFTKENPFKLFRIIEKSKSSAPAKPGQKAPKDIVVPAGPTPFAPGPILSELNQAGIKAGIEGGKVVVKVDSHVVNEGEVIKPNVAAMLAKFGIEPMEIGLDLVCVLEGGLIYDKSVLAIDEKAFMEKLHNAVRWSFNLSVDIGYPTKENIKLFLAKSYRETRAVAVDLGIAEPDVLPDVLAKAYAEMAALKKETGQ